MLSCLTGSHSCWLVFQISTHQKDRTNKCDTRNFRRKEIFHREIPSNHNPNLFLTIVLSLKLLRQTIVSLLVSRTTQVASSRKEQEIVCPLKAYLAQCGNYNHISTDPIIVGVSYGNWVSFKWVLDHSLGPLLDHFL